MSAPFLAAALHNLPATPNYVQGRLVALRPDSTSANSQGEYLRAVATLNVSPNVNVDVSVPLLRLTSELYKTGFLGYETIQLLKGGAALPESTSRSLLQTHRVVMRAPLGVPNAQVKDKAYFKAETVELVEKESRAPTLDSILDTETAPGEGQSTPWPLVNGKPPFTPVPYPWDAGYSADGEFRLGYAVIKAPARTFSYNRNTRVETRPVLREQGTMKRNTGMAYESYSLSYMVAGPEEIKSGVQDVVNQLSLTPFLTVEGGPFGNPRDQDGEIPYGSIAVRSFSISTVDGLPGCLEVNIAFDPFLWDFYVPYTAGKYPVLVMDDAVCWPLFKLWADSNENSVYDGRKFDGYFRMSFPDPSLNDFIAEINSKTLLDEGVSEDVEALLTAANGVLPGSLQTATISSPNVKEIKLPTRDPNTPRLVAMRVHDQSIWSSLANDTLGSSTAAGNPLFRQTVMGLIDWESKLSGLNYTDSQGNFMPQSTQVPITYLDKSFSTEQTMGPEALDPTQLGILDVVNGNGKSWTAQITAQFDALINALPGSTANYDERVHALEREKQARIKSPWDYYAIVFQVDSRTSVKLQKAFKTLAEVNKQRANPRKRSAEQLLADKYIMDQESPHISASTDVELGDILIEHISGTKSHNLSLTSFYGNPLPLHQYIGGSDVVVVVEGKCFSLDAVNRLKLIKDEFDKRAQLKISRKFVVEGRESSKNRELTAGFLRIENEIFQLMGVHFALPLNLSIDPVESQPGVWSFSLTFLEYNPAQVEQEQVKFLRTSLDQLGAIYKYGWNDSESDFNPLLQKAQDWFSLQYHLSQEEVYPDMQLPTQAQFQSWVSVCQNIAELYKSTSNKKRFLSTGQYGKGAKLSGDELRVLDTIREFLPRYAERMSTWTNFRTQAANIPIRSKYMDPDFYMYYDPYGTWEVTLDRISENLMGKPRKLKAEGRDSQPEGTYTDESGPVTFDPLLGVKHTHTAKFWATKDSEIPGLYQKSWDQSYSADPNKPQHAEDVKNKVKAYLNKFDTDLDGQRWWATGVDKVSLAVPTEDGLYALSPEQSETFYSGVLDDTSLNLEEVLDDNLTSGEREQQGLDKDPTIALVDSFRGDSYSENSILSKFNSLGWRQTQAIAAAQMGNNQPTPTKMDVQTHGYWFFPGAPFSRAMSDLNFNRRMELMGKLIKSAVFSSMSGDGDIAGLYNVPDFNVEIGKGGFDFAGLLNRASASLNKTYGYLSNTARLNSNYQSIKNQGVGELTAVAQGNASKNVLDTFNYFDAWSITHSQTSWVDPHIIRAFFLSRDGMGAYNPQLSLDDQGFGDLSQDEFGTGDNPGRRIDRITELYAKYMSEYGNLPTLALALVDMRMTTKARQKYMENGEFLPGVLKDFKNVAGSVSQKRYASDTGVLYRELFEKYPEVGARVNQYWAQYLQLCRSFGSYLPFSDSQVRNYSDPYFYALHGIVQMDGQNNVGKFLISGFSPTGKPVTVNLARNEVSYLVGDVDRSNYNFDLNKSDLDLEIKLGEKLGSALDPHTEAAIYGSMLDVRQHGKFGRLVGAFPSYQVLIINEGFYWGSGNRKLWDQYYSRSGVAEIEVFKSRLQPGSQCNITFSNMFNNLTAYTQLEVLQHELSVQNNKRMAGILKGFGIETFKSFWEVLTRQVPKEVIKIWQTNHVRQLALSPGARLHVRMGYGSNAGTLPIVFNGTVAQMPVQEGYVTLMAVGDGYELEKPTTTSLVSVGDGYAFNDGGPIGFGKDPSSIIAEAMVGASLADNILEGAFIDRSKGVAHFGDVFYRFPVHYPTETQINIYSSNPTKLEQQIPMIANYLNVNALYNWQNVNLFSVQVSEPTLWKVITVCRRACLDYVGSAEEFCTRSTVFFGKAWWPYNYTYADTFLDFARYGLSNFGGVGDNRTETLTTSSLPEAPLPPEAPPLERGTKANQTRQLIERTERQMSVYPGLLEASRKFTSLDPVMLEVTDDGYMTVTYNNGGWAVFKKYSGGWTVYNQDLHDRYDVSDPSDPRAVGGGPNAPQPQSLSQDTAGTKYTTLGTKMEGQKELSANISDFLLDVKVFVQHLMWKNYMQAYFAHSMINLLTNDIIADRSKVFTDAIGTHKYNGVMSPDSLNKTLAYSVDSDIQPGERRTMTVDTGLIVSTTQGGLGRAIAENVTRVGSYIPIPVLKEIAAGANDYISETPTTPAVENAVISALVDSVKEMYQGQFVMCGMPSMKPRDLVLLTDHKNDMRGPVFVKEVVHRLDAENGLITIVTPDCVVYPHSSEAGYHLVRSLAQGALQRAAQFYTLKTVSALTLNQTLRWKEKKALTELDTALARYKKVRDGLAYTSQEEAEVLESYKARTIDGLQQDLKNMDETIKKAREAGKSTDALEEARTKIIARVEKVDKFGTLAEVRVGADGAEVAGLLPEDYEVVKGSRSALRGRIAELELDILADEALDKEAIKLLELREGVTEQKVLELSQAKRRAQFAEIEGDEFIRAQAEVETLTAKGGKAAELVAAQARVKATTEKITQVEETIAKLLETEGELTADTIKALEEAKTSAKTLRATLRAENVAMAKATEEFRLSTQKADRVLRTMARGGVVDDIFGSTVDLVKAAGRGFGNALGSILGRTSDPVAVARQPRGVTKLRWHMQTLSDKIRGLGTTLKEAKEAKGVEKARVLINKARPWVLEQYKMAKTILRAGSLASYAGPQIILRLAADVAFFAIGGSIIEGINARWKARQCVKIVPLMVGSNPPTPYVAGIRGHQGAVVGDDPSWADNLIMGFTHLNTEAKDRDGYAGRAAYVGTNLLMFAGAMLGLEPPEYGQDPSDITAMNESEEFNRDVQRESGR